MQKKLIILCLAFTFYALQLKAQDTKKEAERIKTKMEAFTSKTGTITKFTDKYLPKLNTTYGSAETRVRMVKSGSLTGYFYQIVKESKYSGTTASIEYNDLIEVIKAIKVLKADAIKDAIENSDYLENKFVTTDGFQVGYFISNGATKWYLTLEKYGSDNTLFIDTGDIIETAFSEAKTKIDDIKTQLSF
ncbi:hypothetical protein SAMN05421788_103268 [Filimonas lacunae]|uniref:Uncharacterized protein n=1 Tax=Filimonas lacunae TaxID=477680 RepID=A0A1N7P7K3_9BACT|nr:hypothetical protein [Filimonas lacunae]SIT06635.1 hypothetical protein SAMN05421788_103268 [Filimonas lacunae]